jgi:GNAT superfamily N-acetyltransferase
MPRIREVRETDVDAVAALVEALNEAEGYDTRLGPDAAAIAHAYAGPARAGRCAVAEAAEGLIGYITWHTTYETTNASRGAFVGDLFVASAWRRQGVGTDLLAFAARVVAGEGGAHLWWTALPANTEGQAFYARLGAKPERLIAYTLAEDAFDALSRERPA